ncbi:Zinc transporter 6 [Hypsizygus marmoreus]|uniref:Zinc transporter 6 n=1 Tax=Hypsizygus marmoreus TaxID=39966 RepID=A0A369J9I9_HYPMA|nr:Zinc transporter 6 [Hypsizygus marmoreus]
MDGHNLHRRKSSKDEDENIAISTTPMQLEEEPVPLVLAPPPPRNRVQSTPSHSQHTHSQSISSVGMGTPPPSAGAFRAGFNLPRPPNGINGHPSSPFRSSFAPPPNAGPGHARTRSISSTAFSPAVHSPLASAFPMGASVSSPTLHAFAPTMSASLSAPESTTLGQPPAKPSSRRHARLHSRNLSVFFPRPGSLPQSSISEDGTQELEVHIDEEAPISSVPSAGPSVSMPGSSGGPVTPLGAGFTFGARPPSNGLPTPDLMSAHTTSRRGHHHKHSMSHNFFSFLEPGANGRSPHESGEEELHTQPTPMPVSPWTPMSGFPQSAKATSTTTTGFPPHTPDGHEHSHEDDLRLALDKQQFEFGHGRDEGSDGQNPPGAVAAGLLQFVLGAWLWVCGQEVGSLSVTGLGYWVVFDAFGVGLGSFLPQWLELKPAKSEGALEREKRKIRRPYGNAPVETVLMFAQAVYLMFSSVYVCKETVEHILLSAGGAEGHHHHHGDEDESLVGIEFPIILAFITLISIMGTSLLYNNHSKLVNVTGTRIPSLRTILRTLSSSSRSPSHQMYNPPPTTPLGKSLCNPFVASPFLFALAILSVAILVPVAQHRTCDLLLAALITVVTFNVAYRACTVLGTVLLQTSPARGAASGKMEAFLRAMREVERHPQVVHLPAPHIWQLKPTPTTSASEAEALVVTMELHVRQDLGDDEVLKLTRWAWERCAGALGGGSVGGTGKGREGTEVTVGVVRG